MSVDNAAEDSPSLQPPNMLAPPLRENTAGPVSMSSQLSLENLTAQTYTSFQYGIDEAHEGDVAQQDHMSANNFTPSAVTSES